jgi:Family of unknown function (DUF5681)
LPADAPRDYQIGYKKPPAATRFKKGNRANPHGRPRGSKNLATLLERALYAAADADASEPHGRLTKRELVVARLVERSAGADLAATKLLFELLRKVDPRMVTTPADPAGFAPADDPIAQVRAKLLRLARAQGLVPPSDDPEDVSPTADPTPAAPDATDPPGAPPDDHPIAQVRAKLERLARAQGLVPPSGDPEDDPPTAAPSPVAPDATDSADISGGTE